MKIIKLVTPGYEALVDDEDYERLIRYRWKLVRSGSGNTDYALSRDMRMHRVIMHVWDSRKVDHRDGNGLNNQKYNLRICTSGQNKANAVKYGKGKYKGVFPWGNKWRVYIGDKCGRMEYLGVFQDERVAALAWNKRALELHGEFARLNIIE